MDATLTGLIPYGRDRISVTRGGMHEGTIELLCPHRWGVYLPGGELITVSSTAEEAVARLEGQRAERHAHTG